MSELPNPEHIAIVGAGMCGLATAWFLQQHGIRVTVVDRTDVAAGASWGNAGMLTPAFTVPLPSPGALRSGLRGAFDRGAPVVLPSARDHVSWSFMARLAAHCTPSAWRRAMSVFTELNRLSLAAYDELAAGGVPAESSPADPFLAACATDHDRDHLTGELDSLRANGGEVDYQVVGGDELRRLEPALSGRVRTGVLIHGQRFINPPEYLRALADEIRDRGAEIVPGFEAAAVTDLGPGGVELTSAAGSALRADAVVLAAGSWLGPLARKFGVRRAVQPARGYSFTVRPDPLPTHPVYFPGQRVACTPLGNRFRVTGIMEFRRADDPLETQRIQRIVEAVRPMLTGVDWDDRAEEWVGARPCTADGLPLIGPTASSRVHVAGGHGMWGMALGPLTGKLLAALITGSPSPAWIRALHPLR